MYSKKHYAPIPEVRSWREGFERSQQELDQQQKTTAINVLSVKRKRSRRFLLLLAWLLLCTFNGYSQKLTQSIRGTVIDQESKVPVVGPPSYL